MPLPAIVARIAPALGLHFARFAPGGAEYFEAHTPDCVVTVSRHSYENEPDLNFEDYPYEIELRPVRDQAQELHERQTAAYAESAYGRLGSSLKCRMMLVADLQKKLAESLP